MPRVKRKPRQRTGYTEHHFAELMTGFAYFGPCFYYDRLEQAADFCASGGGTPEAVAEARKRFEAVRAEMIELWEDSRSWLMFEWLEPGNIPHITGYVQNDLKGPGKCTRPWCWWEFSAPEPRRQISDGPPNSIMDDDHSSAGKLHYGVPRCVATKADFEIQYELQAEYLERLGLFLPGEQEYWDANKDEWIAAARADGLDAEIE